MQEPIVMPEPFVPSSNKQENPQQTSVNLSPTFLNTQPPAYGYPQAPYYNPQQPYGNQQGAYGNPQGSYGNQQGIYMNPQGQQVIYTTSTDPSVAFITTQPRYMPVEVGHFSRGIKPHPGITLGFFKNIDIFIPVNKCSF